MASPGEQDATTGGLNSSDADKGPFPFFDLPRELRDAVYDSALVESKFQLAPKRRPSDSSGERSQLPAPEASDESPEHPPPRPLGLRASIAFSPNLAISLSNKALKQEYNERADKAMTLVLKDSEHYSFQQFVLPEHAKDVHWLELHIVLFCHLCSAMLHLDERTCQAAHECGQHHAWIGDLLPQLPKLRSFSICAYLCYDRYKSANETKIPCQGIVESKVRELCKLPKLKELELVKYDFNKDPSLAGVKESMMKWPIPKRTETLDEPRQACTHAGNDGQVDKAEDVETNDDSKRADSVA